MVDSRSISSSSSWLGKASNWAIFSSSSRLASASWSRSSVDFFRLMVAGISAGQPNQEGQGAQCEHRQIEGQAAQELLLEFRRAAVRAPHALENRGAAGAGKVIRCLRILILSVLHQGQRPVELGGQLIAGPALGV